MAVSGEYLRRPPTSDLLLLGVAVVAIATSAPLIAACTAPALAIAFWRCLLGSGATAVWVGIRHRAEVAALTRRQWRLTVLSGLLLGAHFATWVPSLRLTTVASSTALVATQPVWAALIAARRGVVIPRIAWVGIAVALAGVLVLTGVDFAVTPKALVGDLLAASRGSAGRAVCHRRRGSPGGHLEPDVHRDLLRRGSRRPARAGRRCCRCR